MARRLTKSSKDRMLFGVAGGLAQYFDVDPVLIRVAVALSVLFTGIGLVAYVVAAIVMPAEASTAGTQADVVRENVERMPGDLSAAGERVGWSSRAGEKEERSASGRRGRAFLGTALIVVGALVLAANFDLLDWFGWGKWWPALVIGAGLIVLFGRK